MSIGALVHLPIVRFLVILIIIDLIVGAFVYKSWRTPTKGPDDGWVTVFAIWMYAGALAVEVFAVLAWALIAGILHFL